MLILCFTVCVHVHIMILSSELKCCPLTLALLYSHVDCGPEAELCSCSSAVVGRSYPSYPTGELAAGRSAGSCLQQAVAVPFCASIQAQGLHSLFGTVAAPGWPRALLLLGRAEDVPDPALCLSRACLQICL